MAEDSGNKIAKIQKGSKIHRQEEIKEVITPSPQLKKNHVSKPVIDWGQPQVYNTFSDNIIEGKVIWANTNLSEGAFRRNVVQKWSDSASYKQSQSDMFTEMEIRLSNGEICRVSFYGDMRSQGVFYEHALVRAEGSYRGDGDFVANRIWVNNIPVEIRNNNRAREREKTSIAQPAKNNPRIGLGVVCAIFILIILFKSVQIINEVGTSSFLVSMLFPMIITYALIAYGLRVLIEMFMGGTEKPNLRRTLNSVGFVAMLIVAVLKIFSYG